jgi:hypothetical protein
MFINSKFILGVLMFCGCAVGTSGAQLGTPREIGHHMVRHAQDAAYLAAKKTPVENARVEHARLNYDPFILDRALSALTGPGVWPGWGA